MEDSEMIELYWKRDDRAIAQTDAVYGTRLQRLSERILNNREDAQECVNDTYLNTWNRIPPERPNYFFAFLAKICRYVSLGKLDWNRAAKRNKEQSDDNRLIFVRRYFHMDSVSQVLFGCTKAAAATVVEAAERAECEEEMKEVYLDRPFVYMLIDCENNLPFFIGTMMDVSE